MACDRPSDATSPGVPGADSGNARAASDTPGPMPPHVLSRRTLCAVTPNVPHTLFTAGDYGAEEADLDALCRARDGHAKLERLLSELVLTRERTS